MKKFILIIYLSLIFFTSKGQVKTKITGFIPESIQSPADVEISVFYPFVIGQGRKIDYKTKTSKGNFTFEIELTEPVQIGGAINEKILFLPGTFSILVNPGDSLHILVPNAKKLGMMDLNFSGKGVDKIDFQKEIVKRKLALYKEDPAYRLQSISYKFATTDKKLNAIDSIYKNYKIDIKKRDKELIKANEYETVLDMLMLSAVNSKSDSVRTLFEKFVQKKNRFSPFLENINVYYSGLTILRDYILLSEYQNPSKDNAREMMNNDPVNYCRLILKHLSKYPAAKEYLLANTALNVFSDEQDSKNTDLIYRLYSDNVDHGSKFFKKVADSYQIVKTRLKRGMPFYSFSLPDSIGRIHKLTDFKGKVVILDFWFNGCGACRVLAPVMADLEKEYSGKEIQFISISIDSKKSLWLKGIGKYCSSSSLQLFTEGLETKHPLVEFLNPGGYPFLIVIDKNGNLIGPPPDPRGNSAEFKRFINQYL